MSNSYSRREWMGWSAAGLSAATGLQSMSHAAPNFRFQPSDDSIVSLNDPGLHLLVDDEEVEERQNLTRFVNKPKKRSEPVLISDRPWEARNRVQCWGSVIREPNGLFRMWYFAFFLDRRPTEVDRSAHCYAESIDGIHWEKPNLGVFKFRGSTDNNIVYGFHPNRIHMTEEMLARRRLGLPAVDLEGRQIGILNNADITVLRDEGEPDPRKRYKMVTNMQDHLMWARGHADLYPDATEEQIRAARRVFGQYYDTSPDGIHWAGKPVRVLPASADYMMVMRDHRNQRWWLNERSNHNRDSRAHGRNAALRYSRDLIHWSEPEIVFDNLEENDFGRLWQWHGGMTPFNYGNMNLGFLENWAHVRYGDACELICNRDGGPWKRVAPGRMFLDTGPEGAFDRSLAYPTHNAPIQVGQELYIYYTGGGPPANVGNRGLDMAIGLMTIPLDRFAGLVHRREAAGELLTKPLTVDGTGLEINVEPLTSGSASVAVMTPSRETINGFGHDDCQVGKLDRRQIRSRVRWRERESLAQLRGQTVRLHFRIEGGAFFAFRFCDIG